MSILIDKLYYNLLCAFLIYATFARCMHIMSAYIPQFINFQWVY